MLNSLISNTIFRILLVTLFISLSFAQSKIENAQYSEKIMNTEYEAFKYDYDYFEKQNQIINSKIEFIDSRSIQLIVAN